MNWFKGAKPREEQQRRAIAEFWQWWAEDGAAEVEEGLEMGDPDPAAALLARYLYKISPELEFELEGGEGHPLRLVVTAAGKPALRATARRWLRAAPVDDGWKYSDKLPASDADWSMQFRNVTVTVKDALMTLDSPNGTALDIGLWHPAFRNTKSEDRQRLSVYLLAAVLGEADVETWVDTITPLKDKPAEAWELDQLPEVVDRLKASHFDEKGNLTWVIVPYEDSDTKVMAMTRVRLVPAMAPLLQTHIAVYIPYADQTHEGFPGPEALKPLRMIEDRLTDALFPRAECLAVESSQGVRTLHFYAEHEADVVEDIAAVTAYWTDGQVTYDANVDPEWKNLRHLRR